MFPIYSHTCSCSSIRAPSTLKEIYVKVVTRALAIILSREVTNRH
nr:MAG TPA: hypothetical protein [Bacteriophage sp.]